MGNFQYQLGVKETKIALKIPFPRKPKKQMRQARKLDVREMDKVMSPWGWELKQGCIMN